MLHQKIEYLRTKIIKSKVPNCLLFFVIGFLIPFALFFLAGNLFPLTYNTLVLPVLYRIILPCLPFLFLAVILLTMFRPEKYGHFGHFQDIVMFLLGVIVGLTVVNDWWYFVPFPLAVFIPFVVWRLRWHLWSHCLFSIIVVVAIIVLIMVGIVFDFLGLSWDHRFSLGLSPLPDFALITILLFIVAMLCFWAYRHWLKGDKLNRTLLADIIEREPRCSKYFDAVRKITPCNIKACKIKIKKKYDRLPVISKNKNELIDKIFPGTINLPMMINRYWKWGYKALDYNGLVKLIRILRNRVNGNTLPSKAIKDLLKEGIKIENDRYLQEIFETFKADNNQDYRYNHTSENNSLIWKKVEAYFNRYTELSEAMIEAEYFFCHSPSCTAQQQLQEYVLKLITKFQTANTGHWQNDNVQPANEELTITDCQKAAEEYLLLWQQNIDRLIIMYCDKSLSHSISINDSIDFKQLTCNLLTCRKQSYSSEATIHNYAADLALSLFIVSDEYVNKIQETLENYFNEQRILLDKEKENIDKKNDLSELGLACVAYSMWMGSQDNWVDAGFTFTLFPEITANNNQNAIVLRNLAHVKAAYALQELKNGGSYLGIKDLVLDALSEYQKLDYDKLNTNISALRCTGKYLAYYFSNHVLKELPDEEENS